MNLSAAFQAFTQREKMLLAVCGIAVVIASCLYVLPLRFAEKTTNSPVITPPPIQAAQTGYVTKDILAKQDLSVANVKNPFQVPPQYQVGKEIAPTASVGNASSGTELHPVSTVPVLSGIIAGGSTKMAILELGENSDTVVVGSTFGGYTVTSITDTQVILSGPAGRQVLNIGR